MHTTRKHFAAIHRLALALGLGCGLAAIGSAEPPLRLDQSLLDAGWISLFDGHTLFGWTSEGGVDWQVEDGMLVVSRGPEGLLRTTSQFSDFELSLDFRADPATNSGIFLRTAPRPRDPAGDCYELNIAPSDNPFPTGSLVARLRSDLVATSGDWQSMHVVADGPSFEVHLDGQSVATYRDPQPLGRGYVGLQKNLGNIAMRNIRMRPLGMQPLLNGRDLQGWITYPKMEGRFEVTDGGELLVMGGRGQLETEEQYGDFVLQLECKTNAEGLNSGIFFRCIPGEEMMGYECQISNALSAIDPARPLDCGTGGFFRRADARRIVAKDREWFALTLVVEGPRMAAWVDGYQVSAWTDTRALETNPRQGLRLEPGTIMIQAHDPTTDILFRNIRIAPIAKRRSGTTPGQN